MIYSCYCILVCNNTIDPSRLAKLQSDLIGAPHNFIYLIPQRKLYISANAYVLVELYQLLDLEHITT